MENPLRPAWSRASRSTTTPLQPRLWTWVASVITLLCLLTGTATGEKDQVTNFCRRFGHSTALIDRKLYIDGGFINYDPLPSNPTNYTNTLLLYQNLDVNGPEDMPQLYANLSKNASMSSTHGGTLWADEVNKKLYAFGGEYYQEPPSDLTLYSYDVLNDFWEKHESPPSSIQGVSYGAGVSVSEKGEGYYYGGWLSNNSVPSWSGRRMATANLIKYEMDKGKWSNNTGPDGVGRAEGVMVYAPVSDGGMLIYFGGVQELANGSTIGQPMNEIILYDLSSSRWYKQTASGNVPEMRARFCAGVTWAQDRSSYNIYLYGGLGMPPNTAGFDDVYILTIPSFQWIKMYPAPGSTAQQYPHNTLTCNVVDGAQMIIIGGSFPLDQTTCDVPDQFGSHGLDMGRQNPDASPWFVYRKNITSYMVPRDITSRVGGNGQGGATKKAPDGGFNETDLSILMTRSYNAPPRAATRDVTPGDGSSRGLKTGAIVGIAIGGATVFVCLIVGGWCCVRRHRGDGGSGGGDHGPGHSSSNGHMHQYSGDMASAPYSPHSSHRTASGSHLTPASPYPPWSPFLGRRASIPQQPVELASDNHPSDYGAHEVSPNSAVIYSSFVKHGSYSTGTGTGTGTGTNTGSNTNTTGTWNSAGTPVHEIVTTPGMGNPVPNVVYASSGFGPSELGTDRNTRAPERQLLREMKGAGEVGTLGDENSPRLHQTYYHK
ncbi:uncharacterized protein BCR38DRAFT_332031 [Pseudomassariella vexata]|uniref:Attractin/MKLN-like beta-propeller domain-containing protein n=1 Tax=Pseudomassariella vexata TaxID=1141098 RepID=A0A1Y2EFF7_9PEZI|nr:uncharacterized protein BCR38DRAFT_332031 [Pseudomassariella vexata]ORY69535.1 hypothetical protein BCR38DRAFT_332031 [Pseudomassariella vexata]